MAVTKEEKLSESRSTSEDSAPPDGGWGWMIVAGCFLSTICIRAVTRCISMFFMEFQLHFDTDYSTTAWIHSLIDCTTMLCAPLGGFLGSRLSCRATVILGGLLASVGMVISAFASSLEYLYISMGIFTGLGFALSYTPAIAMVGSYFCERKALAYGIALSGSGIGTFILAPVVHLLIEYYTWRGALLILGGFVSNLCVCGALMKPLKGRAEGQLKEKVTNKEQGCMTAVPEQVPANSGPVEPNQPEINKLKDTQQLLITNKMLKHIGLGKDKLETSTSKEFGFLLMPDFLILSVSILFLAYGCSAPVVYLVPYALSVGVDHQHAALLMSIFGVSGIVGNITFGWLTDRKCLKRFRLLSYMVAIGLEGLCCMFVPLLQSFSLLLPFSVLYGYFDGAYVALIPVVTSDVMGSTYLTSGLGVVYFLHAIPYLISPPIGGWLVDRTGDYSATFFLSGACFMCSSVVLVVMILFRHYRKSKCKSSVHFSLSQVDAAAQQGII
ncbi:monocarboxylate transporter 12-B-like [Solea senegalensis]|uniref:Monocarboxylate transporter 12-B-like n=1 Tax=Solea senegalensis TaxID=28829 RepID=A0AAV6S469_SOLSE|nr:monocarboxylate transporter 12-B-like isoform X1 [Solea senegalensis]KAG7512515.1 monocarboxylate transporter 12-B-like [Solea senegalensis]